MGYDQQSVTLTRGQELFLYTDGIYEIELRGKAARSCSSLTEFFEGEEEQPDIRQIHELQEEIYRYTATHQIADDINYIAIRLNEQEE